MLAFSWSTFFVEIVNFLILIWLLTRFLYQPVLRTVAAREARIKSQLDEAREAQEKAKALTASYEGRLADWEREKAQLRESFDAALAVERVRREAELTASLRRQEESAAAVRRQQERDERLRLTRDAAADAARFGGRLLSRLVSPELERRLIDVTIEDLRGMSGEQHSAFRTLNGKPAGVITTRYPLGAAERETLTDALGATIGAKPQLTFKQDEALICGIRIELGSAVVDGNLATELSWFAQTEGNAPA